MRSNLLGAMIFVILVLPSSATAQEDEDREYRLEFTPLVRYIGISGDEDKFREDWWMKKNWAGGLEHFSLNKEMGEDVSFQTEGRIIIPEEDYLLEMRLLKKDLGYIRGGYVEFRKYFDDTGGFFRPFSLPSFDLSKDMHLDIGRIYIEAGLDIPDRPRVLLGYEHRFKEGEKSLLEWGGVTQGGITRNIFPSFKEIDEEADIIRAEVDHTLGGLDLKDRFQYERYRTETARQEEERSLDAGTSETVTVNEDYDHDLLYNTFHVESSGKEKVYWSAAYNFASLDGDAAFQMMTVPFGPEPFDRGWFSRRIDLDQDSHTVNLNGLVGPFKNFTLYGGFQAEAVETDGATAAVLTETRFAGGVASPEADIKTRNDKEGLEENVGIRFTGIPRTTVYTEADWTQSDIDLDERELEDGILSFERITDADVDRERYTLGMTTSLFRRLKFSARLRRTHRENDYDHLRDTEPGYSAFITKQESATDQARARATFRVSSRVNVILQYQRVDTEIETANTDLTGLIESGDFESNTYTLNISAVPRAGLYLAGSFSYRDAGAEAFDNGVPSIIPYEGDVFTFAGNARYQVNKKTNLTLDYLYTRSDNFEDNSEQGLPLGLDNERHGLLLGISRDLTKRVRARLRYGLYRYDEDGNRGVDDYTAHLFLAACEFRF